LATDTRIKVADLDSALPAYSALAGPSAELRLLEFPEFRMASVGPFQLIEGTPESLAAFGWSATLIVAASARP
jgi:hypothetical protein